MLCLYPGSVRKSQHLKTPNLFSKCGTQFIFLTYFHFQPHNFIPNQSLNESREGELNSCREFFRKKYIDSSNAVKDWKGLGKIRLDLRVGEGKAGRHWGFNI